MKYSFLLLFCFMSFAMSAQFSVGGRAASFDASHVNWNFSVSKSSDNKVTIEAIANLESGWHIFSSTPGGDGSLTATAFEVDQLAKLKIPIEATESGSAINKNLDGVGEVKYYEHRAIFKISFVAPGDIQTFSGNINFQICNDVMCMAPTTKSFSVTLK